ncbi:hypothetical protein HYV85_02975 [Candidatus Woesearchaeota archaeon]|nr:hypothetical protein [Candidatus Woesearchaeota archaeon]
MAQGAYAQMVQVGSVKVNYSVVDKTAWELWKNRTNDYGNMTFTAEGLEWELVPYPTQSENGPVYTVGPKTRPVTGEENADATGVQSTKSDVDPKSIIDTTPDEEKFAGEEYKNALPAPRPAGFEYDGSDEDADKNSGLAATQGEQETGKALNSAQQSAEGQSKAPESSAESSSKAVKDASSEITGTSAAAAEAKEPQEAKKDKSGEKKESFFVKVLKWLFGK